MIGLIELGIGLKELGIGHIERGIVLKIDNARRTVSARVSDLVHGVFGKVGQFLELNGTMHEINSSERAIFFPLRWR